MAIDTSTSSLTVAITENGHILGERHSQAERNHSIYLIPMIQELLQSLSLAPSDLDGIAVGVGPGSYTGVRIGVTVAKTMAWTLGLAVLGISSLEALALGSVMPAETAEIADAVSPEQKEVYTAMTGETWIVPLMNARRGQAYTALFAASRSNGLVEDASLADGNARYFPQEALEWARLQGDGIRLMDAWLGQVNDQLQARMNEGRVLPSRVMFVGETEGFAEAITAFAEKWSGETLAIASDMRASAVGRLAEERYRIGEQDDVHGLVPNYTQLAEAEVNLLAKQKGGATRG